MSELENGSYTVEVTLTGGSGKASVESPAAIEVQDGAAQATIIWSSPNYDYMQVNGVDYYPVNEEGNSTFVIDIPAFDEEVPIQAETTAMSTPHMIEYTLYFDSATLQGESGDAAAPNWGIGVAVAAVVVVAAAFTMVRKRGKRAA